jgi:hypothetical protein
MLERFFENLLGRLTGPMQFRLVLQPLMALCFAARAGLRDAKSGREAYFWSLFGSTHAYKRVLLREGWQDVGRIFLLAIIIDGIYQLLTVHWFYPLETLVVAIILAFVPYLLLRGGFTRLGRLLGMGPAQPTKRGDA